MQEFYKKALLALICLLVMDALLAVFFAYRAFPTQTVSRARPDAAGWHSGSYSDVVTGGASTVRLRDTPPDRLRFDFRLRDVIKYPGAAGDLKLLDDRGQFVEHDWSKFHTVSFVAKCSPASAVAFEVSVFSKAISKPGKFETYLPPRAYFPCNPQGVPVTINLDRLLIPEWWYFSVRQDLGRQDFTLDRVGKIMFGTTGTTPLNIDTYVEISALTLHGRDDRYLAALVGIILAGWIGFGIWFFLRYSRALLASVDNKVKVNLPFVAYSQLTMEPFRDKEKALILRSITSAFADPKLDLEAVVEATGSNRYRINEVLKSELGMTFTSYVNKLRLTEASRLLAEKGNAAVSEIAYLVGYANVPYFNKLFKEEFGCTPRSFRTLAVQRQQHAQHERDDDSAPPKQVA